MFVWPTINILVTAIINFLLVITKFRAYKVEWWHDFIYFICLPDTEKCHMGLNLPYTGYTDMTRSNKTCLPWTTGNVQGFTGSRNTPVLLFNASQGETILYTQFTVSSCCRTNSRQNIIHDTWHKIAISKPKNPNHNPQTTSSFFEMDIFELP